MKDESLEVVLQQKNEAQCEWKTPDTRWYEIQLWKLYFELSVFYGSKLGQS
jgi:hypothetical protein